MSAFNELAPSRRQFLKEVALASAAVAGGAGTAASALGAPAASPMGKATKLNLAMAPHRLTAGAVLVLGEWGTYVTFPNQIAGTAVIELVGCRARTFSYSTDLGHDGRPYSYFDLKAGEVYEVTDS